MTFRLSFRLDGDGSGLQAAAKAATADVERLGKAIDDTAAAGAKAGGGLERAGRGAEQVGATATAAAAKVDQLAAATEGLGAAAGRSDASLAQVGRGAAEAGSAAGAAVPGVQRLGRELETTGGAVDAARTALGRYERDQLRVSEAVAAGAVGQREAAQMVTVAAGRYQTAATGAAGNFRTVGLAAQQAGYQIGDFAVQVSSGGNAVVAFIQQSSQLLGFFGTAGAVAGAALAIAGGLYLAFSNMEDAASAAEEAQERLVEALKAGKTEAEAAAIAENVLADALERAQKSSGDLADLSFARVTALREQQAEALNTAQAERDLQKVQLEAEIAEERRKIAIAAGGTRRTNPLTGETFKVEDNEAIRTRQARIKQLEEALAALQGQIERLDTAQQNAFNRDFTGPLQAQVDHQAALTAAYGVGTAAVEKAIVAEKIRQEQERAGVKADSDRGREIARLVTEREREAKAVAELAKAEQQRTAGAERDRQEAARLSALRATTIEDLQAELDYQTRLTEAHREGEEAVLAVEAARKAELIVQRLKLDGTEIEVGLIEELVAQIARQQAATQGVIDTQQEAERTAKQLGQEQKRAAEEASRTIERIADNAQDKLGDILYDHLRRRHVDFLEFFEDTFLRTLADMGAAALRSQLIMPVVTEVVGLAPSLFGLSGPAATAAQQAAGVGGASNLLSAGNSALNLFGGGPSTFLSGLGQAGANYAAGGLGAVLVGTPTVAPAAVAGVAAVPGGLSAAGVGGSTGLLGSGGALSASSALGPVAIAAIAAMAAYQFGLIGPNPSVGPVGIADFSPGLGRGREFDNRGVDPFTADNGGDGESMRPIAEAIAELIADSADRFGATIDSTLRFRVANYASPQGGSGRERGFEVNAFLENEVEQRIAEGKTQEQAIKEALEFAIREAFSFDRQVLTDVSQTISGDTADELLGQLQAALDFDDLTGALREAGGAINANTLAVQEQILALQRQGEERGRTAADATRERFEALAELFAAPEALVGIGRTEMPQPVPPAASAAVPASLDPLPEFERGAWRGLPPGVTVLPIESENGVVQDPGGIRVGDDVYQSRFNPDIGREGEFELVAPDGEVVGAFRSLAEAIAGASEAAAAAAETLPAIDQATGELYDRNLARIREAIQITRADVERDIGRITGEFEEPMIGVNGARYIEGQAALEAYGDQLAEINDAFRQQAQDFPELAAEITGWLIDIPATLAEARDELRQQEAQRMTDDLGVEVRALRGQGAVDTIDGLVETRDTRLTDAAALGVDVTLVNRNFRVAVEKAFDGLDIDVIRAVRENVTDPVVRALADQAIAEQVTTFNRSIGDQLLALESPQTAQLVQLNRRYQEDLEFANDNGGDAGAVMRLYQEQARRLVEGTDDVETALADTVSAFERVLPDLRRFRAQLDTDASLSSLTTEERYALLKADFEELAADAEGGDVEAQAQLEEAGRELLQVSRLVNAANDNYEADRRVVMAAVDASIATGDAELAIARDQLSALNGIDARLAELADALSSGALGNQPTSNLILAQASGFSGSFGNGGFGAAAQAYGASSVQGLGGRPALNAQLAYVTGFTGTFGGGGSGPTFQEYVRSSAVSEIQREAARIILQQNGETPGFVDGGYVLNGTPGVDSVTAKLAGREFVVRAPAVAQLGVPTLSYINETGRLPGGGGDAGGLREATHAAAQMIVAELRQQGDASRLQSRDDADHVAGQVGRLHGTLAPMAAREAHERARPGRAAA